MSTKSSSPYTLDPIKNFCAISGQSTLLLNNILYVTTGYAPVIDNGTVRIVSSPWIRAIDLSQSFSLNKTASVTTILPPSIVPVDIPDVQGATFWYDPATTSVIYAQGAPTVEGGVIRDSSQVSFGTNGKTWIGQFQPKSNTFKPWVEQDTPFPGQAGLTSSFRRFFDSVTRKGYIYGGTVQTGDSSTGQRNQLLTYDAVAQSWINKTTPYGAFDDVGAAIPYRTAAGKLLSIIFGGNLNGTPLSMTTIFIHDIEADMWYRQDTGTNENNAPTERGHFCATSIQAPDNSSTQILLHGGFGTEHRSDIWALSLPSFTWTQLEASSPSLLPGPGVRLQPSCNIVNNRILSIFGGRNLVDGDTGHCDTNQNALFMYDLNKRNWMLNYDATDTNQYKVPKEVYQAIGGE
ncbi:hypothetical protein AA313_de0208355 [Arthrobotrys entomopaga]|nr:hypothetical protein AA313_de0208355 [Arthrobotrys entomopaga]